MSDEQRQELLKKLRIIRISACILSGVAVFAIIDGLFNLRILIQ